MPTALCNSCSELVPYAHNRGGGIKQVRCKCGSSNLTAVSGKWNDDGWDYHDRNGRFVKYVPQETNFKNVAV